MINGYESTQVVDAQQADLDLTVTTIAVAPMVGARETPSHTCSTNCGGASKHCH